MYTCVHNQEGIEEQQVHNEEKIEELNLDEVMEELRLKEFELSRMAED